MARLHGPDEPVYTISVAARILGVPARLLRSLDREGLVEPARTPKNARLYSENDLLRLRRICQLVREQGVNLAGVRAVLDLEGRLASPGGGSPEPRSRKEVSRARGGA